MEIVTIYLTLNIFKCFELELEHLWIHLLHLDLNFLMKRHWIYFLHEQFNLNFLTRCLWNNFKFCICMCIDRYVTKDVMPPTMYLFFDRYITKNAMAWQLLYHLHLVTHRCFRCMSDLNLKLILHYRKSDVRRKRWCCWTWACRRNVDSFAKYKYVE